MKKLKSKFEQFYGITLKTAEDALTTDIYNFIKQFIDAFVEKDLSELSPREADTIREKWNVIIKAAAKTHLTSFPDLLERTTDPELTKDFIEKFRVMHSERTKIESEIDKLKSEIDLNINELKQKEKEDKEITEINKKFKEMTKEIDKIDKNIKDKDI